MDTKTEEKKQPEPATLPIDAVIFPIKSGKRSQALKVLAFAFYFAVPAAFLLFAGLMLWGAMQKDLAYLVILVPFLTALGWIFRPSLRETRPDEPRNVSGWLNKLGKLTDD